MVPFVWVNNISIEKYFIIEFIGAFFITLCFMLINEKKTDDGLYAYVLAGASSVFIISFG